MFDLDVCTHAHLYKYIYTLYTHAHKHARKHARKQTLCIHKTNMQSSCAGGCIKIYTIQAVYSTAFFTYV